MLHRIVTALLLLLCTTVASAQPMVSAADPRAAAAGVEMLRKGGTAADAAIAMMLALGVVEPAHSGLGGGGFLVYHDARSGRLTTYDAREAAPAAADPRWFHGADGKPLPIRQAVPGGRSVGVPGELRLMEAIHADHGRLRWKTLFVPATKLARDGWAITPRFNNFLTRMPATGFFDDWARTYLYTPEGQAKPVGTVVRNPELAAFYEMIGRRGSDAFYVGPTAQKLVATVNGAARNPSKMTTGDLASYQVKERPPVCGAYRGYRICGMGPPASGTVAVLMILRQIERFDMAGLGQDSPVAWHLFAESSRLAYADRDAWLADPDYVKVPVEGLLAADYIAGRSALISPDRTMAAIAPGTPAGAPAFGRGAHQPEHGTSSLTVVDRWGNVAQATVTIESVFGSGLAMNGLFLNNELTDFNLMPERNGLLTANRVEGGKRPRSSMSPLIVYDPAGKVRLSIGAAGGSTIIAQVAKALIGVIDWKLSAQDALSLGLLYAPGPGGIAEKGTAVEAMLPALAALGETLNVAPLGLKANALEWRDGVWAGAADPRSEGVSMGLDGVAVKPAGAVLQKDRPSE
ncbi:gamma-glutamyltransferase family protein [Rhizorhabdus dicambivorans]|uniref:Gamma-glutamyltransferase family protein n=1 Tax=Rhizorhabdus dicambivorans TaxID=1850238 RepID=A0A2A4FSR9_9SPHN|nr:gamma-glutamyltransferase family protein [Rhizorhabdus dicambivorans]ATE63481.1 gamma-glutamyltransferase family protein [Rhizorhabdus dicambivorans]PCE41463.1 gamma-glutamyltransferase family protein [Rhizorhabdus dicambivorans]